MESFQNWLLKENRYLDEGFVDSLKQGYQQSYQQAQKNTGQNLEKFGNMALPAIKKATAFAQTLSKKTGIPMPLATALIASGIVGGPAAVPFAALMYFVKKPLMSGASKAFDAGVQSVQGIQKAFAAQPPQAQTLMAQPAAECFLNFEEWLVFQEGIGDWAGQKIGSTAGMIAGKTVGGTQKITSVLKQGWQELIKFVSENKLTVGKAAFLMGVGALVGAGIGKLTHDAIDSVIQNIGDAGVPPAELAWLRHNFKMDLNQGKHGSNVSGEDLYNTDGGQLEPDSSHGSFEIGAEQPAINMSASDFIHDSSDPSASVDKVMQSLGSIIRSTPVDSDQTTGVLTYSLDITPQTGVSPQNYFNKHIVN